MSTISYRICSIQKPSLRRLDKTCDDVTSRRGNDAHRRITTQENIPDREGRMIGRLHADYLMPGMQSVTFRCLFKYPVETIKPL